MEPLDDETVPLYTVGQVAQMLQVQQAFLRRLDEFGVVRPSRSAGGQRRYSRTEVTAVRYVVRLAGEGMTLAAIGHRVLGERCGMYHALSAAVPQDATARVEAEAGRRGWALQVFDAGEFSDPRYRLSWSGRLIPPGLLFLIATSWVWLPGTSLMPFAWMAVLYVKIVDLVLSFFLFFLIPFAGQARALLS